MRYPLLSALLLAVPAVYAQLDLLGGTTLVVDPGTDLRIGDGIQFSIAAGAAVENNGTINFAPTASLQEVAGWPINGSGTEINTQVFTSPLAATDPAGLGLSLTTAIAPGTLTIRRGHIPFTDNGGMQSVARWYDVDAATNSGFSASVAFRYDLTELNGVDELDQTLHVRGSGNYWTSFASVVDVFNQEVGATGLDSLGLFTLFDSISTGIEGENDDVAGLQLLMEPDASAVLVIAPELNSSMQFELIDGRGALLQRRAAQGTITRIPIAGLAPGLYMVRAGGHRPLPFIRP